MDVISMLYRCKIAKTGGLGDNVPQFQPVKLPFTLPVYFDSAWLPSAWVSLRRVLSSPFSMGLFLPL